jgi:hypothetical protein
MDQLHLLNDEQLELVRDVKEQLDGDTQLEFVSLEYATQAEEVYAQIGSPVLSGVAIWNVFQAMLPFFQN